MWDRPLPWRICDIEIEGANDGEGGNCASILSMGVCGAEPKDAGGDENDCEELPLVICVAGFEDPDGDIELESKDAEEDENDCEELRRGVCGVETKGAGGDDNDCEELRRGVCGVEIKGAGGDDNDCEGLPLFICAAEFEDPDSDIKFENGINGDGGNSGGLPPLGVVEATPKVLEKMRVIDGRYLSPFVLPNSRILTELERSGGRPQPFYVVSLE